MARADNQAEPTTRLPMVRLPLRRVSSPTRTSSRPASAVNTAQRRVDEAQSLAYNPLQSLERNQVWASPFDTMPVVFGETQDDTGGIWVSFPLLQITSENLEKNYVYLLTRGDAIGKLPVSNMYLGSEPFDKPGRPAVSVTYSSDPNSCPVGFAGIACDSSYYKFLAPSIQPVQFERSRFTLLGKYASSIEIAVGPGPGVYPGTLYTFDFNVSRFAKDGTVTLVGDYVTNDDGSAVVVPDTPAADTYGYQITWGEINTSGTVLVSPYKIEVKQFNTFPPGFGTPTNPYTDITFLTITGDLGEINDEGEISGLKQLHGFMTGGMDVTRVRWASDGSGTLVTTSGESNKFADLLNWYTTTSGNYPDAASFQPIDKTDIADAARFHDQYKIFFNGVIVNSTSFLSWAQQTAAMFLLSFYSKGNSYEVVPLLPLNDDGSIQTTGIVAQDSFNDQDLNEDSIADAIIEGTYSKTYLSTTDRRPFRAVVSWRDQSDRNINVVQTTTISYSDYPVDAPEREFDLTEFCSTIEHATIFAKYILASRRYSSHVISFTTPRNLEGTIGNRLYSVISVTFTKVDSAGDNSTQTDFYLVTSLVILPDGLTQVEAEHFPVDETGKSIISDSIVAGAFTIRA